MKKSIKGLIQSIVFRLTSDRLRKVVEASPHRLLPIFDHASVREKYIADDVTLSPGLWDITCGTEGQMMLNGVDCLQLAEQYGTPLYVVDRDRLQRNYRDFEESFRKIYPHVEIAYSYKTNPLPGALMALHEFGAYAEVVSGFELWLALRLGVDPDKIIYNGPGKTEDDLAMAVSRNINLINIDGAPEMDIIDRLAAKHRHRQHVGVRVVTATGWKSKFGFRIETGAAFEAYRYLKGLKNVVPCGMHVHLASGMGNVDHYAWAAREMLQLARHLKSSLDIDIRYFDLGGGYSTIPSVRGYTPLEQTLMNVNIPVQEANLRRCPSPADYSEAIIHVFNKYYPPDSPVEPPTIILEPGRAITSTAQLLLLKVLDLKLPQNGITDVILDGGRNVAAPAEWECHAILHASRVMSSADGFYQVFGPTCTPYDFLYKIKRLPFLKRGDILALMDAGAYFIPTQANFSFPRAAAIMVGDGKHWLIREREDYKDIVGKDILPKDVHPDE